MSWKMMVLDPLLKNHNFNAPSKKHSTLAAAHSSGASTINLSLSEDWRLYVRKGDYITIGPSTASGYEGKIETHSVYNVTIGGSYLEIALWSGDTLDNDFASGDQIFSVATKVGGMWELDINASSNTLWAAGMGLDPSQYDSIYGFDNSGHVQRLIKTSGATATNPSDSFLYTFDSRLRLNTVYRAIAYAYLSRIAEYPRFGILKEDGNDLFTPVNISVGNQKIEQTGTSLSSYNSGYPKVEFEFDNGVGMNFLDIDLVLLGHAFGTSTAANGYVSFGDPLTTPKVRIFSSNKISSLRGISNMGILKNIYEVSGLFSGSSTLLTDLSRMNFYQQQGIMISLEHDFSTGITGDLADGIPPVLIGNFTFELDYTYWDTTKPNIKFLFTGY